jgi:hypothetical protein
MRLSRKDFSFLDIPGLQADLGELVGITQSVVSELIADGVLRPEATLRQWLIDYCAHIREAAAGRGGGKQAQQALAEARVRESLSKALRNEVETGKELGLLIYASHVEAQLVDWAASGVQSVEAAIDRISDGIASEFNIELEDRHVRDHLRGALRDIAAYPSRAAAAAAAGRERVGAAGADPDG